MTFLTDETGYDTSQPIELYRFVGSLGTYNYTSSNVSVTYSSEVFEPVPIGRTGIIIGDVTEKNEVKVTLPITSQLINDYGFEIAPPVLYLQLFRMHGTTGEVVPWFTGKVSSLVIAGVKATIVIPSVFSAAMETEFPNVLFQSQCNHTLYGPMCGKNRNDYKLSTEIASITDNTHILVTDAGLQPDRYYKAGEIVTSYERRLIVEHVGDLLTLNYPFRDMTVGLDVDIFAGCDHSIETCQAKFANLVNFFGFPYTPSLNPFLKGLR